MQKVENRVQMQKVSTFYGRFERYAFLYTKTDLGILKIFKAFTPNVLPVVLHTSNAFLLWNGLSLSNSPALCLGNQDVHPL